MKKILFILSFFLLVSCSNGTNPDVKVSENATYKDMKTTTYGNGDAVLEIFTDFECPACSQTHALLDPILVDYVRDGKITIKYYQFPLTSIHKNAYRDALAALCASEQNYFGIYSDSLYKLESSRKGAKVTDADRIGLAKNIDTKKFKECLSSDKYKKQVDADMAYGDKKGLTGTPSYVLNGKKIDMKVVGSVEGFKKLLDSVSK